MATELTTVLQLLGDLVQRFFQISFWVAESWLLVVPIALLWMYDFMRRQQSDKKRIVSAGYSRISRAGFKRFLLLIVGYGELFIVIRYGDVANQALLTHLLLAGAVVYSGYFLRQGRDWQVVYAAAAGYAFFLLSPQLSQSLITFAIETAENRPLATFAGLFAYLGWRETAMTTHVQREEALRNRLTGWQRTYKGAQLTITRVRISEADDLSERGKMIYTLLRYFMLTPFRGKSFIWIAVPEETPIDASYVLKDVTLTDTQIVDFYLTNQGEYKLITEAVTPDTVEAEFSSLVSSMGITHWGQSMVEAADWTELDLGRRVKAKARYMLPKGVFRGFLIRNEFSKVTSLEPDVSLEFGMQNSLNPSPGSLAKAPLTCTYDGKEIEYSRPWKHLLKMNIPSWSLPDKLSIDRHSHSQRRIPLYQGLELLESCYKNIDIVEIIDGEYEDGTEYQQLRIKNEDPEINWDDINVPVTNYRPPRQDLRRASSRAEWFLSLDTGSFDAELVLWDPNPDAARGRLSAIYDSGPHQFKATWEDIEDECLAESLVEIKHNPSLISDEGVIWKRE